MSRYTEDQLVALNKLKESVEYLNDTGLQITSWMAQGVGRVTVSLIDDDDWDDRLSPALLDEIMKWD